MNMRRKIKVLIVVVALILVGFAIYGGLQMLESSVFHKGTGAEEQQTSKTVTRDGIDYFPRQDITTLMILGIDETGPVQDSLSYNNEGESDVVLLVIFDETNEKYDVLAFNRDTMTDIPILGLGGKKAGTKVGQLALAHTYGSGLQDSCENTREAISGLLGGNFVDYYVSMNMDAIPILNDAAGGVTVTVTDDFSEVGAQIPKGVVTLHGQQALDFVQIRKDVGTQMNISRMERQKEYMHGFVTALNAKLETSTSFVLETYDAVSPYVVTDCTVNTLNLLVNRFSEYEMGDVISPAGENVKGNVYMEFYLDEDAFDELILSLLYSPKENKGE